jgi:hypothetical protein
MTLCEKAEPLEHRSIAEPVGVVDEGVGIGVLATQVLAEAIGNSLDTAAGCRVIEHVDDRSVYIRDQYPTLAAPDSLGAEKVISFDVFEREDGALALDQLLAYCTGGEDQDVSKDLFGEVASARHARECGSRPPPRQHARGNRARRPRPSRSSASDARHFMRLVLRGPVPKGRVAYHAAFVAR